MIPLTDAMPLVKELRPLPLVPLPWVLPSLFAACNVAALVFFSGLFFAFPCRWLAQNGEWAFPTVTAPLFVLTFFSLVSLNFSDPGILHQGSAEQGPLTVHVVWVNHGVFRLQWCPECCFHCPPRTYHCPWCNVCVEDFDHHCRWVNNCIGHRNFRFFMLLVLSLCLYSGALLVTCLIFLVRTAHLPFSTDKAVAIVVAVPAAGFLVPLSLLLLIQAVSVSSAHRTYEGKPATVLIVTLLPLPQVAKASGQASPTLSGPHTAASETDRGCTACPRPSGLSLWLPSGRVLCLCLGVSAWVPCRHLQRYNPFDQGCASNWYLTICAPLGPKYMADAVQLQSAVGPDWTPMPTLHSPTSLPACACLQPPPLGPSKPGKGPPGSGEAAALQEGRTARGCPCCSRAPGEAPPSSRPCAHRCPQHQHLSSPPEPTY
ncbi:Palmitoyltransferase ZDHHC19 [Plecturocebus cupreus]